MRADDAMMHVQVLMPELFSCRAVGEGFAAIVNAVQSSFENLHGQPLNLGQAQAIRSALLAIRNEPRLVFERSTILIAAMEAVDLSVDPASVEGLAEWLSE
jgi:hypothetical protein